MRKVIAFSVNSTQFEFHTQLRMVRRVGSANAHGYWSALDKQAERVRNAATNAQKLMECLL